MPRDTVQQCQQRGKARSGAARAPLGRWREGAARAPALPWTFLSLPLCCRKSAFPPFPALLPQSLPDVSPVHFSLLAQQLWALPLQQTLGFWGVLGQGSELVCAL